MIHLTFLSMLVVRHGLLRGWETSSEKRKAPQSERLRGLVAKGSCEGCGLVRHEQPRGEIDQDLRPGEEKACDEGDAHDGGIDVEVAGDS